MIKLRLKLNRRKDMDVEEKKDIFDKLMHLPVLNILEPFYICSLEGSHFF